MWRVGSLLLVAVVLSAACQAPPASPPKPAATVAPPTAAPTIAPAPAPTRAPDYGALRGKLLPPLGALIAATRSRDSGNAAQFLREFNAGGDEVLAAINGDLSVNGNRLHSVVTNVREAATRGDADTMERMRLLLLDVR